MNSRKLQFADRGVNKNIRKIKMPMLKTLILVGYKRRPNWIPEKKNLHKIYKNQTQKQIPQLNTSKEHPEMGGLHCLEKDMKNLPTIWR